MLFALCYLVAVKEVGPAHVARTSNTHWMRTEAIGQSRLIETDDEGGGGMNAKQKMLHAVLGLAFGGVMMLAGAPNAYAQITSGTPTLKTGGLPGDTDHSSNQPPDPMQELMETKNKLQRNDDRQRRLVSDTDRLLVLANQLKSEVAASGSEMMTPLMLHQMDEIEKLARSVKEKMRN